MRQYSAVTLIGALFFLSGISAGASAQATVVPGRGELLYTTHCVACHNARVHWRDQKLATDWASLRAQVRRWQGVQKLGWGEPDITEVARYLNTFYYRYTPPG